MHRVYVPAYERSEVAAPLHRRQRTPLGVRHAQAASQPVSPSLCPPPSAPSLSSFPSFSISSSSTPVHTSLPPLSLPLLSSVSSCSDLPLTSRRTSTTSCFNDSTICTTLLHHPQQIIRPAFTHNNPHPFITTIPPTLHPHPPLAFALRATLCRSPPQADSIASPIPTLTVSVLSANLVLVSCFPSFSTP